MSDDILIARRLEQLGFDFELACVFVDDARQRGRIYSGVSVDDVVTLVADLMTPRGVFFGTADVPRQRDRNGRRPHCPRSLVSSDGSWIIA